MGKGKVMVKLEGNTFTKEHKHEVKELIKTMCG